MDKITNTPDIWEGMPPVDFSDEFARAVKELGYATTHFHSGEIDRTELQEYSVVADPETGQLMDLSDPDIEAAGSLKDGLPMRIKSLAVDNQVIYFVHPADGKPRTIMLLK